MFIAVDSARLCRFCVLGVQTIGVMKSFWMVTGYYQESDLNPGLPSG
ncbi:hypothetical protein ACSW29_27330 [Rhodococcus sp. GB-02]